MSLKIIGLSGTNGSGKDTIAALLGERNNYYVASATDMLRDELEKRGLPTDREHKAALSAEWRREHGMAAIVDRAYEYYKAHESEYSGMIVGSLRHPGEADEIHRLGGKVVWVDADPKVRYARVIVNAHLRGRAAEDDVTYEEFLAHEAREMAHVGDEATLNMGAVKERADITIENNGNDLEKFKNDAEMELIKFGLTSA